MKKPLKTDKELNAFWFYDHLKKLNKPDVAKAKRFFKQHQMDAIRAKTKVL